MPADPTGAPPTVYLHIGAPKSGTTFLQGLLWHNAGTLREHGVLMPGGSFAAQVRATRDLRGLVREPDDPAPDWTGAWDLIASRIKESDARVAVVSNEVISAADAEQAGRAVRSLEPAEVHVVYSARDLAGLLPSEWQEYVKHRFHYDFGHWLGEVVDGPPDDAAAAWFWRVHDIPEVLARWSAHVPPERVHVLTMPRPGAPRELLWERFAGLIGVDPAIADLSEARANAALSWTETELLRRINGAAREDAPMWLYHRLVTDVLALRVLPGQGAPGRVPLPGDRRDWAATRARELVESIRSAGYDVVGDLDELLPGDAVPDAAPCGRRRAGGRRGAHHPRPARPDLHAARGRRGAAPPARRAGAHGPAQADGPASQRAQPGGLEDAGGLLAHGRAHQGHRAAAAPRARRARIRVRR